MPTPGTGNYMIGSIFSHFARVLSETGYKAGQMFSLNNTATPELLGPPFLENNSG